jgi:H+/gluconate symporter-like permease
MVSLWLRSGGSVDHVIDQLEGIGSSLSVPTRDGQVMSVGDALGKALRRYMTAKKLSGLKAILLGEVDLDEDTPRPGFWTIIFVLLLPLVLIFFNTLFTTLEASGAVGEDNVLFRLSRLIGNTPIALLIATLFAMYLLYLRPRRGRGSIGGALEDLVDNALAPVCSIILITGAGGAFGRVLTETGIGATIAEGLDALGLPVILAGFLVAIAFRVAQGSATVAANSSSTSTGSTREARSAFAAFRASMPAPNSASSSFAAGLAR